MNKSFSEYLKEFFNEYLPMELNASNNTIETYKFTFQLFIKYLIKEEQMDIKDITFKNITKDKVIGFLNYLEQEKGNKISTRNNRLIAIKSFYRFISYNNPLELNNIQNILSIRNKKVIQKDLEYLTIEEMEIFFKAIPTKNSKDRRNLVLLTLLYDSAARIDELLNLKIKDLELTDNPCITLFGKGQKIRKVIILTETKDLITKYIEENNINQNSLLFFNSKGEKLNRRTIEVMMDKYTKKSQISKHVTPHTFRRTKAVHLLEAEVNIVYIRDILGHSSITTTERYAKVSTNLKKKNLIKTYSFSTEESIWEKDEKLLNELLSLK